MTDPMSALPPWVPYAAAGLGLAATLALGIWIGGRRRRARRTTRSRRRAEDALTFVAAALATAVTSQGMWRVFEHRLHMPIELRGLTFAFLEIAMLTCGIRARSNIADPEIGKAGPEGAAVWALAGFSGFVSATDSKNWHEALIRLAAPLAAAWLWERGLHVQRTANVWSRRRRWFSTIHWRITPERILVALGVAEPQDRSAAEVDVARHITRIAVANARLALARRPGRKRPGTLKRAGARAQKAWLAGVKHTPVAHDPDLLARVDAETALLIHATAYADLPHRPSWMPAPNARHQICLGDHAGPGVVALRLQERGRKRRTLHPAPLERTSPTSRSLIERIREARTDRRLGVRPGPSTAPAARTGQAGTGESVRTAPRTDLAAHARTVPYVPPVRPANPVRTGHRPAPRTVPPLAPYGAVRRIPVQPVRAGLALLDPPARTARTEPPRTGQDRTAEAPPLTAVPSPAEQVTAPVPAPAAGERKPREHWARVIAEEIRTATAAGHTWAPIYDGPTGMETRTGWGRSWCEKTVRAARDLADQPRTGAEPPPRTGTGT